MDQHEPEADENLPLSKTKKKQQAKEVEKLAIQLVELPLPQFRKLPLDEETRAEVKAARETLGRGSHKRQVKHLAGVLRAREDILPAVFAAIEEIDQVKRTDKRQFHGFEELRDRLCAAESFQAALEEMVRLWPAIDAGGITRLAQSVHNFGDKRAYREIFKRLRDSADHKEEP